MCLAVPMQLIEITGEGTGKVNAGGVKTDVSLMMIPHVKLGDYLIVHAGFGIEVLDDEEAGSDSISSESSRKPPQARRSCES